MLDQLRDFFGRLAHNDRDALSAEDDPRVAAAALLFHVMNADGVMNPEEAVRLRALLKDEYGLSDPETERIAEAGEQADREAVDLFRFTRVIMNRADEAERIRFIDLLWDLTYADGTIHELEDNLVWRISELLGVSSRDRMLGKREAHARAGER